MHKPRRGISVIIPALNEQDAIGRVIRDIPKDVADEIIVVDNGSMDNTAMVAEKAGARVVREPHRGYGAACLKGIASVQEPDIIVFLDGDYSDYPEEMARIVAPIARRARQTLSSARGSQALTERQFFRHRHTGETSWQRGL